MNLAMFDAPNGMFEIAIKDKYKLMSVREGNIPIRTGYLTEISVAPESYFPSKSFLALEADTRQCETPEAVKKLPKETYMYVYRLRAVRS